MRRLQISASKIIIGMLLTIFMSQIVPCSASASSLESLYNRARKEYQSLQSTPKKRWSREAWQKCIQQIQQVIQQDSEGEFADKCYYLLGQSYHALFEAYKESQDFDSALRYYRLLVYQESQSNLADDAQYLMGVLYLEKDAALAYPEFVKVGVLFPNGDMAPKAAKKVTQLEKRLGCKPTGGKKIVVERPTPSSSGDSYPSGQALAASRNEVLSPVEAAQESSGIQQLQDIRYWSGEDYTRIAIYVDGPVAFEHHTLPPDPHSGHPARIYLDLRNCVIGPNMQSQISIRDGFLQDVRVGQFKPSQARVVLDIESIQNFKVFFLPDPFRLVIDVRGERSKTVKVQKRNTEPETRLQRDSSKATVEIPPLPHIAENLSLDVNRIVIDPGHGGKDPGAVGPNGVREKDVVLDIAKNLKKVIEAKLDCEVILTRTGDQFLSLEERTAIANMKQADLFISLHVNAHRNKEVQGIETYYLSAATDEESARVAAYENAISAKKLSDLEAILRDLMVNTKITESSLLASKVQGFMVDELSNIYKGVRNLGVKHAPFYVLLGAEMPCILIETAFISNQQDEQRLNDQEFRKTLAKGIMRGVESYVQSMKRVAQAGDKS